MGSEGGLPVSMHPGPAAAHSAQSHTCPLTDRAARRARHAAGRRPANRKQTAKGRAWMTVFWMSAIFSGRQSSPRLPREMMMPSASLSVPLKFSSDWGGVGRVFAWSSSAWRSAACAQRAGRASSARTPSPRPPQPPPHKHTSRPTRNRTAGAQSSHLAALQLCEDLGVGEAHAVEELARLVDVLGGARVGQRHKVDLIHLGGLACVVCAFTHRTLTCPMGGGSQRTRRHRPHLPRTRGQASRPRTCPSVARHSLS